MGKNAVRLGQDCDDQAWLVASVETAAIFKLEIHHKALCGEFTDTRYFDWIAVDRLYWDDLFLPFGSVHFQDGGDDVELRRKVALDHLT